MSTKQSKRFVLSNILLLLLTRHYFGIAVVAFVELVLADPALAFVVLALDAVVPSIDVGVLAVVAAPALDVVPSTDVRDPAVAEIVAGLVADLVVAVLHPVFHIPLVIEEIDADYDAVAIEQH